MYRLNLLKKLFILNNIIIMSLSAKGTSKESRVSTAFARQFCYSYF